MGYTSTRGLPFSETQINRTPRERKPYRFIKFWRAPHITIELLALESTTDFSLASLANTYLISLKISYSKVFTFPVSRFNQFIANT